MSLKTFSNLVDRCASERDVTRERALRVKIALLKYVVNHRLCTRDIKNPLAGM